jgi:GntR family transcriptional regulator
VEFNISPTSGVPIYQQLVEQVCAGIARGKLKADERLPSVRELSQMLVVNPNTVARAYTELEREEVLYTRPGMGVFVAQPKQSLPKKVRRERLIAGVDRLLVEAVGLGFAAEEVIELVTERAKQFQWNLAAV